MAVSRLLRPHLRRPLALNGASVDHLLERVRAQDIAVSVRDVAQGTPEAAARCVLGMYQAAQQGRFAGVDPLLATLVRREPRTVRDLLAQPAAW